MSTAATDTSGTPATGSTPPGGDQSAEADTTRTPARRPRRERRRNNNRTPGSTEPATPPTEAKFTGRCDELKGEVYDCSEYSQVDGYTKTTREIAEYVGRTYSANARTSVETLVLPTFDYPNDPPEGATETDKVRWKKKIDTMVTKEERFEEDLKKVYSLIWGQCTEFLRAKLEAKDGYARMKEHYDTIDLLKSIKDSVFKFSDQKYAPHSLHEAMRKFYTSHQDKHSNAQDYYQRFKNQVEVVEHCGGSVGRHSGLIEKALKDMSLTRRNASPGQLQAAEKSAKEAYMACAFLLGSDRKRYGKLIEDLENDHVQRNDKYPKTLVEAYNLLIHWKQDPKHLMRVLGSSGDGLAFAHVGENGEPPQDLSSIQCYHCQQMGHYANVCTNDYVSRHASGTQALLAGDVEVGVSTQENEVENYDDDVIAFNFANVTESNGIVHHQGAEVCKTWILLDNQSTVDVFCNSKLLRNIRKSTKTMNIKCNAGITRTNLVGDLPGYGEVWFNKDGIANILSLSRLEKKYRITYDSTVGKQFIVHKGNGIERKFIQSESGLFYLDAKAASENEGTVLVNTVAGNSTKYTSSDYKQATLARKLQNIIGRPSARTFLNIVEKNLLKDCPVVRADVLAAEDIFGPNLGALKGKTVRHSGNRVRPEYEQIPSEIMERYTDVTLCIDIMFVNKLPFLVTISKHIKFGTVEAIKSRKHKVLLAALKGVKRLYALRGFRVKYGHVDNEFEPMRGDLQGIGIQLNVVSNDEHVPEVERQIRTIKERTRCVYNTVPFKRMPSRMVVEMVHASVFWLNMFPASDGVSDVLSPRGIIVGLKLDYNKHCQLEFGSYVQVHEEHDNSMESRTTGAIALRPTGNAQGGYYFLSLTSGRRLSRNRWTTLPMPQDVIDRVHVLARRSNANRDLTFAWRDGTAIADNADEDDDDDDSDYDPDEPDYDSDAESDAESTHEPDDDEEIPVDGLDLPLAGVDEDEEQPNEQINVETVEEDEEGDEEDAEEEEAEEEGDAEGDAQINDEIPGVIPREIPGVNGENDDAPEEGHVDGESAGVADEDATAEDMDSRYGPRSGRHNLRPRHKPSRKYCNAMRQPMRPQDKSHLHATLDHYAMTQYSVKKGLQVFGEAGKEAVSSEMQQFHDMGVGEPKRGDMLTRQEKSRALNYLMFLKRKRCGRVKGRGCADGRKQRLYKTKQETSAPTVAIESLFLTCTIDAKERRTVVTADIPGAFMQTDVDEVIHVRLEGPLASLLAKVDPELYDKYLEQDKKGKPVMYVKLKKALYGTLQAAMLFWKDLSAKLVNWGYEINPYDWCVANKMIDGKQCTVVWHVDDLKISHVDPEVVDSLVSLLDGEYGKINPLVTTHGKVHEYLGMTLDYTEDGKVKIIMKDYITNMLAELPDDMSGESATPAALHLFTVNEKAEKLDEPTSEVFHHHTAQLLFLSRRARPDIQTAVSFLTRRVKAPDVDDYKKLRRVMQYLRGSINLVLTLEADDMQVVKWFIDASYGVHHDLKSHTGATMTLGKGSVYSASRTQRINTKSSTEAELVGVDDNMAQVLWTRYFLGAQGYDVRDNKMYQDNQSTMLLENNGRASSSKRTRHINVRYFFVTDRIKNEEVSVEYCPTGDMVGDFFTKPLQGCQFRKFRNIIMNVQE
jgi:hypothetical protein